MLSGDRTSKLIINFSEKIPKKSRQEWKCRGGLVPWTVESVFATSYTAVSFWEMLSHYLTLVHIVDVRGNYRCQECGSFFLSKT